MPLSMSQKEKTGMINIAKNIIILCLGDKALRNVMMENIVASV